MAIRTYLAISNDIVREGLKGILSKNPIFNQCGEYSGTIDMVSSIERLKPSLLFFNPFHNTGQVIIKNYSRLHFSCPKMIFVLIMSDSDKNDYYRYINMDWISGFFDVNVKMEELFKGLSCILSGKVYVQESIKKNIDSIFYDSKSDKYKINSLTRREVEVLKQVANGMFNKEIATLLNISERTVKNHMSNIFKKIEVSDRTQAAVFAIKNNLVNI